MSLWPDMHGGHLLYVGPMQHLTPENSNPDVQAFFKLLRAKVSENPLKIQDGRDKAALQKVQSMLRDTTKDRNYCMNWAMYYLCYDQIRGIAAASDNGDTTVWFQEEDIDFLASAIRLLEK